jgi:hypothetical protein
MAISVFPAAVTSSINASSITAVSANTMYAAAISLPAAIYTVTCSSSTIAKVEFYSGVSTLITTATTSSGTVAINLASAADRVRLWTNTGSDIVVTITQTAAALTNNFSGTLDTITTVGSSTYTGTSTSGFGYAVVVGGGGGGGGNSSDNYGAGGGSGAIAEKLVTLTGSMAVVIGAGGTAGTSGGGTGGSGGSSTFAGMTAGGGVGGAGNSSARGAGGTASGGTYNTSGAGGGTNGNGTSVASTYQFVKSGSTGSGGNGSGGFDLNSRSGAGSGIGTGGNGGYNGNGASATGYGAGGGGGSGSAYTPQAGGTGAPGVLYVLRF